MSLEPVIGRIAWCLLAASKRWEHAVPIEAFAEARSTRVVAFLFVLWANEDVLSLRVGE